MPEVKLKTRKNKEKLTESVGWAVNADCKEVEGLNEGFSSISVCVCVRKYSCSVSDRSRY